MWILFAAAAALASTTWTLDVPDTVPAGEPIPVRVTVENTGSKSVSIPADLADSLRVSAAYVEPGARNLPAVANASLLPAVSVKSVQWEPLAPGERRVVELEPVAPEGASAGVYTLQVYGAGRRFSDATVAYDVTDFKGAARVEVDAQLVLHGAGEVPAQLASLALRDGDLIAAVVLVNTTGESVWVPDAFLPQCEGTARVKKEEVAFVMKTSAGGQSPTLGEDQSVLLAPRETVQHEVNCGALPEHAKSVRVRVTLKPPSPVVPRLPSSSRHVLEGSVTTPSTFVSAKRLESD